MWAPERAAASVPETLTTRKGKEPAPSHTAELGFRGGHPRLQAWSIRWLCPVCSLLMLALGILVFWDSSWASTGRHSDVGIQGGRSWSPVLLLAYSLLAPFPGTMDTYSHSLIPRDSGMTCLKCLTLEVLLDLGLCLQHNPSGPRYKIERVETALRGDAMASWGKCLQGAPERARRKLRGDHVDLAAGLGHVEEEGKTGSVSNEGLGLQDRHFNPGGPGAQSLPRRR